jgi:hypothetical protein
MANMSSLVSMYSHLDIHTRTYENRRIQSCRDRNFLFFLQPCKHHARFSVFCCLYVERKDGDPYVYAQLRPHDSLCVSRGFS